MEDQSTRFSPASRRFQVHALKMEGCPPLWQQRISDGLSNPLVGSRKRKNLKPRLQRILAFSVSLILLLWLYMVHDGHIIARKKLFNNQGPSLDGLKFIPADNPYIHVNVLPLLLKHMLTLYGMSVAGLQVQGTLERLALFQV